MNTPKPLPEPVRDAAEAVLNGTEAEARAAVADAKAAGATSWDIARAIRQLHIEQLNA